ncbi:MAG TPA: septal ring lytic transglycosylase RlpA family protein [Bdellovibrionales bacterium]|nr:septal ring lytic transglycosylase RlpA family protein [Bdellovibrionales bacterium]
MHIRFLSIIIFAGLTCNTAVGFDADAKLYRAVWTEPLCNPKGDQYPSSEFLTEIATKSKAPDKATLRSAEFLAQNCQRIQSGKATLYADKFQGRETKSGEVFDQTLFSAASNTQPLGSELFVLNPQTGKAVLVRINDTGGFKKPRVIDLSESAFSEIGDTDDGILDVQIYRCS